jgi:hypothetical protein
MIVEDGAVDVDREALGLRGLDGGDRPVKHALLAHRFVVVFLEAVEMHREKQVGRRREQVQLLLQEQRVGAQRDELLARHDAGDDLADLLVDQRLAARNGHHRGAAFVDRIEALLDRHAPIEDGVGIVDLAAARAGEIAPKQRLEHQHQRIALASGEPLLEQIGAEPNLLEEWDRHHVFSRCYDVAATSARPRLSSRGKRNSIVS